MLFDIVIFFILLLLMFISVFIGLLIINGVDGRIKG